VAPPNDVPAITAQLRAMLERWESRTWGLSEASKAAIERYHIDRQAAIAGEVMDQLIAARRRC
jgi:hypothetical protein